MSYVAIVVYPVVNNRIKYYLFGYNSFVVKIENEIIHQVDCILICFDMYESIYNFKDYITLVLLCIIAMTSISLIIYLHFPPE